MKSSIRKQMTLIFVGLVVLMFVSSYMINNFFLEDYYSSRKQSILVEVFNELNSNLDEQGRLNEEAIDHIEDICNSNSLNFIVTDKDYNIVVWTDSAYTFDDSDYARLMRARLNGYGIGLDVVKEGTDDSILAQNINYTIQKKFDPAVAAQYLEMWGTFDQGYHFIMRISMESIRDSVSISTRFLAYICLICGLISVLAVYLITKKITRPLAELTRLSEKMADLDFDAKYTSGGENEIGQLGQHFNQMSENLQKAYSQLMTANNELKKDIEEKQQIDEMRKEFLSNVSHELKTPIALIQGYAEGLEACINDDPESREFYCEVIMDEAHKMNALVQKLLTLNQLEFGNDQVVMERFDLAQLIRNKLQSVNLMAKQKEAEISYVGEEQLPVWADEFKTEEVLTNYLSNALNHIDGARKIIVKSELIENKVRVSVFNNGKLIPTEDLERIWDKFYKVDKARTREYGGSGVGLSIVKAIMESFHQDYGVYNTEDGVVFWFELLNGNENIGDL